MKKLLTSSVFLFLSFIGFSQNVEFEKANFPDKKEGLKEAQKRLNNGKDLYVRGRQEFDEGRKMFFVENKMMPMSLHDYHKAGNQLFKQAMPYLLEAQKFNSQNSALNYMIGFISFLNDPVDPETVTCLEKAVQLGGTVEPDAKYWLAWAYHLNSRWDDAKTYYEQYKATLNPRIKSNQPYIDDVQKKITECEVGKILSAKPERVFVDNLGPTVNSGYPEYSPKISTDEEKIFFTSRRPNSIGGKKDDSEIGYFEDGLYASTKADGRWQGAKQLSKNVNTDGHDATAGLSPDGTKLYVFRSTLTDNGDLYQSVLNGLDWEKPTRLNKNINTRFHESSASLSFDSKRLYFVSNKDMGFGASDIYFSELDVNGDWGLAKNMGPVINTKYPEDGAFMHPDGVTLYFSSKGPGSMGGYDIFKSSLINGKWQTPVNLGYPINGPDDDVFFVVSGSGNRAYFSSAKTGGYGGYDIYKITFLGPEKQPLTNSQDQLISMRANPVDNFKVEGAVEIVSSKLTILKGVIMDAKTQQPIEATLELIDNEKNEVLATFKSNVSTGKYLVTLPSGKNYGVAVKAENYLFHSENFLLPEAMEFQEFVLDIEMQKLEIGTTIVLKNIFFDSDKSELKSESLNELNRLVKLLKDNANARIEIGSHTDDQGTTEYNLKLSEQRSKAVVAFLKEKGIADDRLVAKGYGESKPVAKNETEEGRQNNRRTEFKVLSK